MSSGGIKGLLADPAVRSTEHNGRMFYSVLDVLNELLLEDRVGGALAAWEEVKARRAELAAVTQRLRFADGSEGEALDVEGVLRLTQSVSGERAERVRWWLAEAGREKLEESEDPEAALRRARQLYESRGHDRKWVDKRLRGMSARQELTSEWYRRGARASDDFRDLTNEIIGTTFGMPVEEYRRSKRLTGTSEQLRDHMTELELALTTLAETAAAVLHREHDSRSVDQLRGDAHTAGEMAAHAREELEKALGHPVTQMGSGRERLMS
jgi:hypothetical protein